MMRHVVTLVLVLLLVAAAARGEGEDRSFHVGRWYGGPIEDGEIPLCMMSAHFETGGRLVLILTTDKILALAIERKGWNFDEGARPKLRLQLDRRPVATLAVIGRGEVAIMAIADAAEFGPLMDQASTLRIVAGGEKVSFKVGGSGPALLELLRCAKTGAAGEASASADPPRHAPRDDPFALPEPRIFDQLRR
jgi:hypothetical protein